MKKRQLMMLVPLVFLFILSAQSAYAMRVEISPQLIDPNDTNTFEVVVEDAADLGGFQFDLTYDNSIVTIESVVLGDFLGSTGRTVWDLPADIDNAHGRLTFGSFSVAPDGNPNLEGPSGSGTLASVTFTLKTDAEGVLTFDPNKSWITATQQTGALPVEEWAGGMITPTCDIVVTPPGNGTIMPSGTVVVKAGANQSFTITPNACYEIADVKVDGVFVGAVNSHTFESISCDDGGNHIIAADFTLKQFTITPNQSDGGSISPAGPVTVNCGSSQTFTMTPDNITPDQCHHIGGVWVNEKPAGAVSSHTIENVTSDQTITASFPLNSAKITASAGANGKIEPVGEVSLICESGQNFTITPDPNYHIGDVKVDGVSVGAVTSYTFANPGSGNHTIVATFEGPDICSIVATTDANGTITPSGTRNATCGSSLTFEIKANECHQTADVKIDGQSVDINDSYILIIDKENQTLYASFEKITYAVTGSAGEGGRISDSADIECGGSHTVEITPDECYQIAEIMVNDEKVDCDQSDACKKVDGKIEYAFADVRADQTIQATFEKIPYTITSDFEKTVDGTGKNGIIEPSGEVTVKCGEDQTFTITPNEGSAVLEVRVNGEKVFCDQSEFCQETDGKIEYTFKDVREDHNRIYAIFEGDDVHTITAQVAGGGDEEVGIEPFGEVLVTDEEDQAFIITATEDYPLLYLLVDGVRTDPGTEYTFPNVRDDHTIMAVFEERSIAASSGENGKIEPSGEVRVPYGQSQFFTITPDACYPIATVTVDGDDISVPADGVYEFENMTENHVIDVAFERVSELGDINGDGTKDISDAILLLRLMTGSDVSSDEITLCADVNEDGKLGPAELVFVLGEISK